MTDRAPLKPVEGLTRQARIPGPPPRKTLAVGEGSTETPAEVGGDEGISATPAMTTERPARPPRERQVAPRRTPRVSDTAETMRSVTLSLSVRVVEQLRARAVADRVSQPEVLMDALAATQDQLAELVAATIPTRHQLVDDGLFVRPAPRVNAEPLTTLSLRMLSSNVDAIDRLVVSSRSPSRSLLCALALRAYLDSTP